MFGSGKCGRFTWTGTLENYGRCPSSGKSEYTPRIRTRDSPCRDGSVSQRRGSEPPSSGTFSSLLLFIPGKASRQSRPAVAQWLCMDFLTCSFPLFIVADSVLRCPRFPPSNCLYSPTDTIVIISNYFIIILHLCCCVCVRVVCLHQSLRLRLDLLFPFLKILSGEPEHISEPDIFR